MEFPKKTCAGCKTPKNVVHFGRCTSTRDGRNPSCRDCCRKRQALSKAGAYKRDLL